MKVLFGAIGGMVLVAAAAFGLPALLPGNRPSGVSAASLTSLKHQATADLSSPALWVTVESAYKTGPAASDVEGTVGLRTLFGITWAKITVFHDGNSYDYHNHLQAIAIGVFVGLELVLGAVVVWQVFK